MLRIPSTIIVLMCLFPLFLEAQIEHKLIRRVAVFPIDSPSRESKAAEEAWWKMRDLLAKNERFLVATKRFLLKNDVYQARKELEPSDVIILGKLLDAHAVVVTFIKDRKMSMIVYDGYSGLKLWERSLNFQPSQTMKEQIGPASERLMGDFISQVPYQGFQILDPVMKTSLVNEGDLKVARVNVGSNGDFNEGDEVQWIQIFHSSTLPLFESGAKMEVVALGKVLKYEEGVVTVEVLRSAGNKFLVEGALVRFPKQVKKLQELYAIEKGIPSRLNLDTKLLSPEAAMEKEKEDEERSLSTVLSWVSSLAILLILAF